MVFDIFPAAIIFAAALRSGLAIELSSYTIRNSIFALQNFKKIVLKKIRQIDSARNFAKKEFKKLNIKTLNNKINSLTFFCDSKFQKEKLIKFLLKKRIYVYSVNSKNFDNLINITTTNRDNLKIFFKALKKFKK